MKNKLFSFILLICISIAGFKLFLHYRVKGEVDNLVAQISPFVDITYDGISTDIFNAQVAVKDIEIKPRNASEGVKVGSIGVKGANFFTFKDKLIQQFDFSKASQHGFNIQNLELDINSSLFKALEQGIEHKAAQSTNQMALNDHIPLAVLGYDKFNMDLDVDIHVIPEENAINIVYTQNHKDMFRVLFDLTMVAPADFELNPNPVAAMQAQQLLKFKELKIQYQDQSYMRRAFNYQAQKQNKTIDELTNDIYNEILMEFDKNAFTLQDQYMKPLKEFLKTQDTLTITLRPSQPMSFQMMQSLHLYKPEDIPKILNMNISAH